MLESHLPSVPVRGGICGRGRASSQAGFLPVWSPLSESVELWSREDCDPIGTPSGLILKVLCVYIGVAISGGLLMFL